MKHIFRALVLGLLAVSCGKITPLIDYEGGDGEQQFQDSDTTLVFTCFKDSFNMDMNISADWNVSISPANCDWCHYSPASGKAGRVTICLKTDENPGTDERKAEITLLAGNGKFSFHIVQNGGEFWMNENWWDRTDRQRDCVWGNIELVEFISEEFRNTRYDTDGHCTEDTVFSLRGGKKPVRIWKHEYDARGRRISTSFKNQSTGQTSNLNYEYGNGDILVPTSYKCWLGDSLAGNGLPMTMLRGLSKIELRNDMGAFIGCIDYNYSFRNSEELLITLDIWKHSKTGDGDYDREHEEHTVVYRDGLPFSSELVKFVYYQENGMFKEYVDTLARRIYHESQHKLAIEIYENLLVEDDSKPYKYIYSYKENWDLAEIKGCLVTGEVVQDIKYTEYDYEMRYRNWCSRIIADVLSPDRGMNALNESRKFTYYTNY